MLETIWYWAVSSDWTYSESSLCTNMTSVKPTAGRSGLWTLLEDLRGAPPCEQKWLLFKPERCSEIVPFTPESSWMWLEGISYLKANWKHLLVVARRIFEKVGSWVQLEEGWLRSLGKLLWHYTHSIISGTQYLQERGGNPGVEPHGHPKFIEFHFVLSAYLLRFFLYCFDFG